MVEVVTQVVWIVRCTAVMVMVGNIVNQHIPQEMGVTLGQLMDDL